QQFSLRAGRIPIGETGHLLGWVCSNHSFLGRDKKGTGPSAFPFCQRYNLGATSLRCLAASSRIPCDGFISALDGDRKRQNESDSTHCQCANVTAKALRREVLEYAGWIVFWLGQTARKVGVCFSRSRLAICRHVSRPGLSISADA